MTEIKFEIKTRGSMLVCYGDRTVTIYGELAFSPSAFYADKSSIKNWNIPYDTEEITETEKKEIMEYVQVNSIGTKIYFE
jgi:hypothetical protein